MFSLPCQDTAYERIWAFLADLLTLGKYLQEQIANNLVKYCVVLVVLQHMVMEHDYFNIQKMSTVES